MSTIRWHAPANLQLAAVPVETAGPTEEATTMVLSVPARHSRLRRAAEILSVVTGLVHDAAYPAFRADDDDPLAAALDRMHPLRPAGGRPDAHAGALVGL
jgi:hypothetical protein